MVFSKVCRFAGVLAIISLTACQSSRVGTANPPPRPGGGEQSATARSEFIAPGEAIEVYVVEDDSLSGRYLVRSSGHIIFPGVGRVLVAGLTPSAAESAIRHALQANQLKTATVMVERSMAARTEAPQGVTVFFSGAVQGGGRKTVSYVAGRRPTLYQGILEAGGFSRFADQKHVTLTRNSDRGRQAPITVDLTQVRRGTIPDPQLEDGDIVNVPEKAFGF